MSAPASTNGIAEDQLTDTAVSGGLFDVMSRTEILAMFLQQAGALVSSPGLTQMARIETEGSAIAPVSYVGADNSALAQQNATATIDGNIVLIA